LIVVCATFVAEPLEDPLGLILGVAGLETALTFAPYNQIFQQLLSPGSELSRNAAGVNILLVRFEDFARDQPDPAGARRSIQRCETELADALSRFAQQMTGTLILCVLPPSRAARTVSGVVIEAANQSLLSAASRLTGVSVLETAAIDAMTEGEKFDVLRDELAHIPYSAEYYSAMALAIARRVHTLRVPAAKVLVLDCDNTLWRGVVGEDGVEGLQLPPAYLAVQEFAVRLQDSGILICLASKNTESDVLEVFERRADMALQLRHVVAHRVNWLPKPANLVSLAAELNLGLDAFVFIDDNPVECGQMRAEFPQVTTLQLPAENLIGGFLENLWVFDKLVTTAEDANRTRMYRENSARRAFESDVTDIGQFMAALELKIDIAAPVEEEWPRIEQLTQRTNQFNFTTLRQSAVQLRTAVAAGAWVLRVRVSDRFGDYGLVGAMMARREAGSLMVDNLMLSCRVLGRGVEHSMLRQLGEVAASAGLDFVCLPFKPTARNEPARAFADSVVERFAERASSGTLYKIPTSAARAILHRPGQDPIEVIEARRSEEKKASAKPAPLPAVDRSSAYSRIALDLTSGASVVKFVADRNRRRRTLAGSLVPPTTDRENRLLEIWRRVLGLEEIGIDDDYFALGGTSLQSVSLFAEINREFGLQLKLTGVVEAPTIRTMARLLASISIEGQRTLVCLRPGGLRNVFLVHDGLGETLLYLNLAKRMPAGTAVYGIEPKRLPGIPLAHGSIEDMARHYVDEIRKIQPGGPYLLGGMCAGGVIAYAMAVCLKEAGESVESVIILDGATPQAIKRIGRGTKARLSRLQEALAGNHVQQSSRFARFSSILSEVLRKGFNVLRYAVSSLLLRGSTAVRFWLIRRLLRSGRPWPAFLPEMTVQQIYAELEARYRPSELPDVTVFLVRASLGEAEDTPYREVYRDEDFGWRRVAHRLELLDVIGGHSSMLQERHIDSLASVLLQKLTFGLGATAELEAVGR
jgi:FkbH-like protein